MRPKPYPLSALAEVRRQEKDGAARVLAEEARQRETIEAKEATTRAEREAHKSERMSMESEESERLERGHLTVADLSRLNAYRAKNDSEAGALTRAVEERSAETKKARDRESTARAALADRAAAEKVIEKHQDRWTTDAKNKAAIAEEAEAEDRPR